MVGDVLGARAQVDRRLAGYADRVAALAAIIRKDAIARYSVALLRFTSDELRIVRGGIFGSSILVHLAVRKPASTDLPGENANYVSIAEETVGAVADSDVIIYFVGGGGSATAAAATFDRYTAGDLWRPARGAGGPGRRGRSRGLVGRLLGLGGAALPRRAGRRAGPLVTLRPRRRPP